MAKPSISEAALREAEAQSLHSLAAMFRSRPGAFSQAVGADLAVHAADFQAEAQRLFAEADMRESEGAAS